MIKYKRYERYKDSGVEWIGEIPEEWEFRRISHICTLGRGRVISKIEIAENEGEYPVYSSQTENDGVLGYINTYDFEGDYVTWTTDGANAGTVFRRTGRFNCTNVCGTLKPKENNLDLSYLTYALSLETKRYVRLDINPKLMNNEMAKIRVLFPPSDEQKAIANFLDQKTAEIDSLIADKEKLIELLQEKRQAVITEAVTKGLNPNVRLKDSGIEWIGEIPEHWNTSSLRWYVSIKSGDFISQEDIDVEGKIPVIGGNGLMSYTNKTNCNYKTIAIGRVGALCGNVHLIRRPSWITDNALFITNLSNKLYIEYLFYVLKALDLNQYANKTAQPLISGSLVKSRIIPIPPIVEQAAIADFLDQKTAEIDDLITEIKLQIQKLKEYRQSLISEAVTGKIDVREFGNMSEVIYYEQNNSPCSEFTHIAE